MATDIFFSADIRNVLLAGEQATNAMSEASEEPRSQFTTGYLTGYRAALTTLALAFGLTKSLKNQPAFISDGREQ